MIVVTHLMTETPKAGPLTREMLEDALRRMPTERGKSFPMPVPQWLYDAAPPEWKSRLIVMEYMPESIPVLAKSKEKNR
jgi:hypothetical protein